MLDQRDMIESSSEASVSASSEIEVLSPPSHIVPLDLDSSEGFSTWAAYDRHPAYRDLIAAATLWRRLTTLAILCRCLAFATFKRLVCYYLIPMDLRHPKTLFQVGRFVRESIGCRIRQLRALPSFVPLGKPDAVRLHGFPAHGCAAFIVPDAHLTKISNAAENLFTQLRDARGSKRDGRDFFESRIQASRHNHSDLFDAINDCLATCGVLGTISLYLDRAVQVVDVTPQINDASDDFWGRVFPDRSDPIPRMAYLHKDASGGGVKLMIYLSDVGPSNGPLSYVLQSHRLKESWFNELIAKANDYAGFWTTELRTRERFASLPSRLRRKAIIGHDIEDTNPMSERLMASEWTITGRRGTAILFDPNGLHRGGMVEQGERLVINCVIG